MVPMVASAFPVICCLSVTPSPDVTEALTTIRTRDMRSGWIAYVDAKKVYYRLDTASVLPPNGNSIVAAADGGNWIQLTEPFGPGGAVTRYLWVDQILGLANGDGSDEAPFGTIQEALDAIGTPASFIDSQQGYIIQVITKSGVVEPIAVPARRLILLRLAGGSVSEPDLGQIDWTDDVTVAPPPPGVDAFGALILDGFVMGGDIVMSDNGEADTKGYLALMGVTMNGFKVDGTAHASAGSRIGLRIARGLTIPGDPEVSEIDCPTGEIDLVENARISGDVTLANLGRVEHAMIGEGMSPGVTWTLLAPIPAGSSQGFFDCAFEGSTPVTLALPALPAPLFYIPMDGTSDYSFRANGGLVTGNARRLLVDTGLVSSTHAEANGPVVLPQQPADVQLVLTGAVQVAPGQAVVVTARVEIDETAGVAGTLNYVVNAIPSAGPAIPVDLLQDSVAASGHRVTTFAGRKVATLFPDIYTFEIRAGKDPAGSAPTLSTNVGIGAAQLLVEVVNT